MVRVSKPNDRRECGAPGLVVVRVEGSARKCGSFLGPASGRLSFISNVVRSGGFFECFYHTDVCVCVCVCVLPARLLQLQCPSVYPRHGHASNARAHFLGHRVRPFSIKLACSNNNNAREKAVESSYSKLSHKW